MSDIDDKINELERRLDELIRTQIAFQEKTSQIRYEIGVLRAVQQKRHDKTEPGQARPQRTPIDRPYTQPQRPPVDRPYTQPTWPEPVIPRAAAPQSEAQQQSGPSSYEPKPSFGYEPRSTASENAKAESAFSRYASKYAESARTNLEEFIGENLISKIGIVVLLLGIGIGVKYAIDNNLISPLTRVIIGYVFGFGLIGFAIRLKPRYLNFSAVLLSGGMAAMYFVTYFAYSLYGLIGQSSAFALMAMFTVFTVAAALIYNRQVIAHIGLVGAYAVPFLLSNDSGAYAFLFSYIAILNAGILALSIKRVWRPMIYTSSGFTWLIFLGWFLTKFSADAHFTLALIFLWLFFGTFYAANIILGRDDDEKSDRQGLLTGLATAAVFYAFCFGIGSTVSGTAQYVIFFAYLAGATALVQVTANIRSIEINGTRKPLFYIASAGTWATLLAWFINKYSDADDFSLALIFLGLFFAIFYALRILHAVRRPADDREENLVSAFLTTLIFFGFCFGLSNLNPGNSDIISLFSYLAVFSAVILITSYRFYGRFLVLASYPFTWLIFGSWFMQHYSPETNFTIAVIFSTVFFLVYYGATLIYRMISEEIGLAEHAGLILTNSFVFYGFGYAILDSREELRNFQGLYTAAHGLFHFAVAQIIGRAKTNASDVVQVLTVLIITFLTLTVPVQFDGNHVTMSWAIEGALLFWLARLNQIKQFEYFSYPVAALATGSLVVDWLIAYARRASGPSEFNPQVFANGNFVTALVFLAAFSAISIVNRKRELRSTISQELVKPIDYIITGILLFVLYNTFRTEIDNYYHLQISALRLFDAIHPIADLTNLNASWQIQYTMAFLAVLGFANLRWKRSLPLSIVAAVLGALSLFAFVTVGSGLFYALQQSYLADKGLPFMYVGVRYVGYVIAAALIYSMYLAKKDTTLRNEIGDKPLELAFDAVVSLSIFVLASGELINLMANYRFPDSFKYGLSVLWGVYALALIAVGIRKWKRHLRIGAMVLLGITLLKLFFFDIADLPTVPKTILFVSLGILMLIVSFLYTKYKDVIFGLPRQEELES